MCVYIYIYIVRPSGPNPWTVLARIHPVRIARFHVPRFSPRVGLPRDLFLIGSLTAALRFSKGWVRKDLNLRMRTGCIV